MASHDIAGGRAAAWCDWSCTFYFDLLPELSSAVSSGVITPERAEAEGLEQLRELARRYAWRAWQEDIAQETIMRLRNGIAGRYSRTPGALRFLQGVVRNVSREFARGALRAGRYRERDEAERQSSDSLGMETVMIADLVQHIRRKIKLLSPTKRAALLRVHPVLALPGEKLLSEIKNESVERHRALKELRELLESLA